MTRISRSIPLALCLVAGGIACERPQASDQTKVFRRDDDVIASGAAPVVMDSVAGDAILAGRELRFAGATGGDYLGAGGRQTIGGRVHGSVRAAGGEMVLAAAVDRNVAMAGGRVTLDSAAVVQRSAYLAGGMVHVYGTVRHGLHVAGGTVVLNGVMERDVMVSASELLVGPHAVIQGNLSYRVPPRRVHIDPSARISGRVTALPVRDWRGVARFFRAVWLLGFLVVGIVAVALMPMVAAQAAAIVQGRPWGAALTGITTMVILPIVLICVAATVLGLPLAFLGGAAYIVLLYAGRVVLALWLGERMLGPRGGTGRGGAVLRFLAGGVVLTIIALIPVIGPLIVLAATVVGFGALLLELRPVVAMAAARPVPPPVSV